MTMLHKIIKFLCISLGDVFEEELRREDNPGDGSIEKEAVDGTNNLLLYSLHAVAAMHPLSYYSILCYTALNNVILFIEPDGSQHLSIDKPHPVNIASKYNMQ